MKQECTAIGMATSPLIYGACEKEAPMDLAVKLMEEAIEDAQKKATQICKAGCICKGKGTPIDIVCYSVPGVDGQKYHQWRVTAAWDGECECPGEAKEQEPPFEFIEAKFAQLQEFFERLPETP